LYVVLHHARYLLHEGNAQGFAIFGEDYSFLNLCGFYFLALFRFGHEAVLFFFVLSGFVIHLRQARNLASNPDTTKLNIGQYLIRRTRRIYPPLVAALVLTSLFDFWGERLNPAFYSGQTHYALINSTVHSDHSWTTLAGNAAMVMDCYTPTFGTNGPLWSLKYEWWFYLIYPLLWPAVRLGILTSTVLLAVLILVTRIVPHVPLLAVQVLPMMAIWWLGVLLAEVVAGRVRHVWAGLGISMILLPVLYPQLGSTFLLGLVIAMLIWAGLRLQAAGYSLKWLNKLHWLGGSSYTLYVCHMPMLVLMGAYLEAQGNSRLPRSTTFAFAGTALCVAICWGLHFIVERPFMSTSKVQQTKNN